MAEAGSEHAPASAPGSGRAGRRWGSRSCRSAEKLHVDPKVVENLEAERFDALGAPVFVRGHLKHYSELISEKASELLDLYGAATQPALPDLTKLPKAAPDSNPEPARRAGARGADWVRAAGCGVVGGEIGGWARRGEKPKRGPQPVAIAPEVSRDPAARLMCRRMMWRLHRRACVRRARLVAARLPKKPSIAGRLRARLRAPRAASASPTSG